ncbi:hypothetical protein PYJP_01570 [Pyrofollis japonicus]|uniref:hypothetical protein n=1 Tax=Pyrofollis japonicus TaxID=3060460 RepID=UPI00295BB86A|nr:hypothetical protein [Pyrofollis japonicus]BEP16805.1 hypothetical protein PYJP_01570 [Pyrofollis japonicus]
MVQDAPLSVEEAIRLALRDVTSIVPKLAASVLAGAVMALLSVLIVRLVARLLRASKIDELLDPLFTRYGVPFTLSSLINGLLVFALVLITIYVSIVAGFPEYGDIAAQTIIISARIASVFVMILLTYVAVNYVTEKLRMEKGLKGFMALVIFDISLILIVDVTALSPVVKEALAWGLSLGLGLSIAVFTAWYFFGQRSMAAESREAKKE